MEISKLILLFFLIGSTLSIKEEKKPFETEDTLTIEEIEPETNQQKEKRIISHMNELLNIYINSKGWDESKELDDYSFTRLFVYVTSNSLFSKRPREQLTTLAEKMISIHSGPILIKDIKKYFNYEELKNTYKNLFGIQNLDL